MIYDKVFVLGSNIAKIDRGEYEFLPEDKHGFLHGEIRVIAAQMLRSQGRVKEIIVVAGPAEDGMNKAKFIAEKIGGTVTQLECIPSTWGNLDAIKAFFGDDRGKNAFLTSFYHLPRAMRFAAENGLNIIPVCAEAILLTSHRVWGSNIKYWYSEDSMLTRILSEIQGLSDLEGEKYIDYVL